jgi:hypothetical protein
VDRLKAVLGGESGSLELSKSFGEVVIGLLREDEFRCSGRGHWRGVLKVCSRPWLLVGCDS